ncbi:MAG: hypothetical protein ABI416_19780 [Ginsengibacter sp.]
MKEEQMLALLAKLCGDITVADNADAATVLQLQQAIAAAIINDPTLTITNDFHFDQLEDFSTRHLDDADLQHLRNVLQRVQESPEAVDPTIRVFRREVPVISGQVRNSVPEWARGARIEQTIGPVFNRQGRRFWVDVYRTIPVVQVWLQGAPRPFLLLPLEVSNILSVFGPRSYKIPKGSVWINADLFAPTSPDDLYCGLTVTDGEIAFTDKLFVSADNKLVIPQGMEASVKLNLGQKEISDVSPDDNGIDIKEATIILPKTLSFTINHTGKSITVEGASWNLYGQAINFTFDNTKPMRWSPELNRVAIPYKADVAELEIVQCKSPVCTISGKAQIADAAWVLSAAVINIAAPLQADGIGAVAVGVLEGLEASWIGLKDASLFEKGSTHLKNALVMLMPGRINIATLFASNPTGKQRFKLWQEPVADGLEKQLQYIDLLYTKQFFFFYDSLQKGTETISAQANCITSVDKPVKADGAAFAVESLQTVFTLSMSQALQVVMLYDDDLLKDNWNKTHKPIVVAAPPPVTFESTAIALNNALLTISPVYGMLLYGDLKDEDSFDKCLLVFSFGLLQYLPTLPDPYAANVSLLRRRRLRGPNNERLENKHLLSEISALLVCLINWENMDEPAINFFFGDKPANAADIQPGNNVAIRLPNSVRFDILKDQQALDTFQRNNFQTLSTLQSRTWQAATVTAEEGKAMTDGENSMMMAMNQSFAGDRRSPFSNAFTLLDVSTNADLMGVSLGFANDDFIFRRTHTVKDEINGNPISINGLDVHATSRLVQIYALPQISWEPMISASEVTNPAQDPFPGILYFLNDGVPAQIANTANTPVNLAPIPLTKKIAELYEQNSVPLWGYFTLSNGMMALAMYLKDDDGNKPEFQLIEHTFKGDLTTALQIKTVGFFDEENNHKKFLGSAHQLSNINNLLFPATNNRSVLSGSVTEIFNDEFGTLGGFSPDRYVPLERYDFSGYGANIFSHWINANAALAQTSQAMFDVWRGRTAHEVIQVKSVIYPWGIRVVRTITIYRGSNGFPWRTDSGWKAESDGIYDFRTPIKDNPADPQPLKDAKAAEGKRAYVFHPGMVEGVYNVRNIKEDTTLAPFTTTWNKTTGVYIGGDGHPAIAPAPQPLDVKLVPVYFDADVEIDNVTQGATNGRVLSQHMFGYLQLAPRGVFIDENAFASLLTQMDGLGGPVDCMVNIHNSGQFMRVTRVEVNPGMDAANRRVFVVAAKGTPVLPGDGSWSVVEHSLTTKEVQLLSGNDVIPLVRDGERKFPDIKKLIYDQDKSRPVNVAEAAELFKALETRVKQYGFLQSTGENKVLFRNPLFEKDVDTLKGSIPDLADAYHLMNSKGVFPKLEDLPSVSEIGGDYVMKIKEQGYKLLNTVDPAKPLAQALDKGPWYIVKTNDVKVYIQYESRGDDGNTVKSMLNLDIDSTAKKWLNKMNDISMFVDLGSFEKILVIRGKFDTKKGEAPKFIEPILEFGEKLKPVYDILVLLSQLSINPNYKDILKNGLKIAMSNSPENWEYKFQADKELPILRFPPPELDTAAAPLRLEANLKAGVYFNVAIPMPPTNGIQAPSAGAFVEFYAKLSVMCLSVGVGTIYAVGQVTVRISADTVIGPALYMKFGFGVEAVVALPVIGSVSVYFAVGVEMSLDSTQITIGAFVLFRGRAEILGGIVTVTIQIEASGKVQDRIGGAGGETTMIAQVTFSLDISICFIIDISFTETWQEQKQIS